MVAAKKITENRTVRQNSAWGSGLKIPVSTVRFCPCPLTFASFFSRLGRLLSRLAKLPFPSTSPARFVTPS